MKEHCRRINVNKSANTRGFFIERLRIMRHPGKEEYDVALINKSAIEIAVKESCARGANANLEGIMIVQGGDGLPWQTHTAFVYRYLTAILDGKTVGDDFKIFFK